MTRLDGARILITGATGGLGAPLTRLLAGRGATLALVARDRERLAATAPPGAVIAALDLRDPQAPQAAVTAAVAGLGGLDGVVQAAGVVAFGPVAELDDEALAHLFELNVFAPIRLLRAALPALQAAVAQGRAPFVVSISAVVAEQPVAGMAAYGASKAALAAFDAAAARELRRARVRLVDVRPPHTETGLATRPVAGTAPALPAGLRPNDVAARIVRAIEDDERDVPSSSFA